MQHRASLAHTRWECKYHVVFVPKYRRKVLYGQVRRDVGRILRRLCEQRRIELIEGHAMPDHVHLCLSIPPKFAVSEAVGFLKGKSAIWLSAEVAAERRRTGRHFWARGYFVSTVGLDEKTVREYIRDQEREDRRLDQLQLP
jgi:putative transposase